MKKRVVSALIIGLMVIQSVLMCIVLTSWLEGNYQKNAINYFSEGTTINLTSMSSDKKDSVYSFLQEESNKLELLVLNLSVNNNRVGVQAMGEVDALMYPFNFMGENVINYTNMTKLLNAKSSSATLGVADSKNTSIASLATIGNFNDLYVTKLSKVDNDYYIVRGLANQKIAEKFYAKLSKVSGVSASQLKAGSGVAVAGVSSTFVLSFILLLITWLALIMLIVGKSIMTLSKLGELVLLGWSRREVARNTYRYEEYGVVAATLLSWGTMTWLFSSFLSSFNAVVFIIATGILQLLVCLLFISFGFLLLLWTSPLKAIRRKYNYRPFIAALFVLVLAFHAAIATASVVVGTSVKQLGETVALLSQWKDVQNYQIVKSFNGMKNMRDDNAQYNFYRLYRDKLANKRGVYYAGMTYYSQKDIEQTTTTYDNALWQFSVSPNYLSDKMNIKLSKKILNEANQGVRLYLIPDTLSKKQQNNLRKYALEDAKMTLSDDKKTNFEKYHKVKVITYHPVKQYFSWSTDKKTYAKNPLIYVVTPNNMSYFDYSNLTVNSLEDATLKINNKTVLDNALSKKNLNKYSLSSVPIKFTRVKQYVDGLIAQLSQVLMIGLGLILFSTILLCLLAVCLLTLYSTANERKLAIKLFLGYGMLARFKAVMVTLAIFGAVTVGAAFCYGVLAGLIALLGVALELGVSYWWFSRRGTQQVLKLFKGE